ncbi:MAG: hypothetical protein ABMA64_37740 [Myxococcota bacterium]|jgi:hypothetical protein
MGIPLAPPTVHAIDGVIYSFDSPTKAHRTAWMLGACAAAVLFSGGTAIGLGVVGAAITLAAWSVDRSVDLAVRLHQLEIRTTRLGAFGQTRTFPWHELVKAELDGRRIVITRREHRPIKVAVWGPVAQLAWVVGAINAQIQRKTAAQLPMDPAYDLARIEQLLHRAPR